MKQQSILILTGIIVLCTSCRDNATQTKTGPEQENIETNILTAEKHNSLNAIFIGDTLLHGYSKQIQKYLDQYLIDSCKFQEYDDSTLIKTFETPQQIGDLNNDKVIDNVFVLPPLNFCEDGQSYYFTDTNLPRLQTDSYCCHPASVFNVGDIDENGISEIGQYYSSCASRYKSLYVYSLIDNKWREVGHCVFDLGYSKHDIDLKSYIRKTGKGQFQMLEITDLAEDKSKIGKKNWLKFEL
jgi:hypothetical protein